MLSSVYENVYKNREEEKKKITINICYLEGIWALDIFKEIVILDIISSRNIFFLRCKANSHLENSGGK